MFDIEKAAYCTERIKEYFKNTLQDANVEIPDVIKINSDEYLIYLFYSCLLDYGMRSKIYHANLINTYNENKNIFNPKFVVENYSNNELELFEIIKGSIHPRYPNVALKKWLELSKYIYNNFPGENLREKITSLKSYRELYDFITSINGYGQKTGGLLLRLIYEFGICNFKDEIQDIPIDRHDIEISYLNGIIEKEKLNDDEVKRLGQVWINAANKNNISACDIDKYLWSIGNNLCSKKECKKCPLQFNCKKKYDGIFHEKK